MKKKINSMSTLLIVLLTLTAISFIFPSYSHAIPAYDGLFKLKQSSGISIEARQRGDEWYHWVETKDGYGIYKNTETGNWEYYLPSTDVVTTDGSSCQIQGLSLPGGISHVLAGEGDPALYGIPKGLRPVMPSIGSGLEFSTRKSLQVEFKGEQKNNPVSGTMHLLVIGVEYTDAPATYTAEQVQPLLFGASNSVSDYYSNTSYSSVTIVPATESHGTSNDGFIGWLRLGDKHPNPGRNKGIIAARPKTSEVLKTSPVTINLIYF